MNAVDLGPCALPRLSAHKPVLNGTFTNSKHAVPRLHSTQWLFPHVIMAWFLWMCDSGVWWTFRRKGLLGDPSCWEYASGWDCGKPCPHCLPRFLQIRWALSSAMCSSLFASPSLYQGTTSNGSTWHCRSALQTRNENNINSKTNTQKNLNTVDQPFLYISGLSLVFCYSGRKQAKLAHTEDKLSLCDEYVAVSSILLFGQKVRSMDSDLRCS